MIEKRLLPPLSYVLGWLPTGSGQHRVVSRIYSRWLSDCPKGTMVEATLRSGLSVELDISDFTQAQSYLTRRYDPALISFLSSVLEPGDTYLDVGGHIGMVALSLALKTDGLSVHAFEPHPENAAAFRKNMVRNNLARVTLNEAAVGNEPGEVTLRTDVEGSDSFFVGSSGQGISVPCTTLDDYIDEKAISRVGALKLDIEGQEPAALAGAQQAIDKGALRTIVCELSPRLLERSGASELSLVDWLTERGYVMREIPPVGLHRLRTPPTNTYRNVAFMLTAR